MAKHTDLGLVSLILGILCILLFPILALMKFVVILAAVALITGIVARFGKAKDSYGTVGIVLAIVALFLWEGMISLLPKVVPPITSVISWSYQLNEDNELEITYQDNSEKTTKVVIVIVNKNNVEVWRTTVLDQYQFAVVWSEIDPKQNYGLRLTLTHPDYGEVTWVGQYYGLLPTGIPQPP